MRHVLALVVLLVWGLWFGGLVTLFLMVTHLFSSDRATAVVAAPKMFFAFERYQMLLAAVALIAAALWRLLHRREVLTILFFLFAIAATGTVLLARLITRMDVIRRAGESSGPIFKRLHGQSMTLFTIEAIALFFAGGLLWVILTIETLKTARATEPASAPPAEPAGQASSP